MCADTPETQSPDYKDTLNLPRTEFPMRANLAQREPAMLARWQDEDIYAQIRAACKGRPRYVIAETAEPQTADAEPVPSGSAASA